jgi:hypothetical protein
MEICRNNPRILRLSMPDPQQTTLCSMLMPQENILPTTTCTKSTFKG